METIQDIVKGIVEKVSGPITSTQESEPMELELSQISGISSTTSIPQDLLDIAIKLEPTDPLPTRSNKYRCIDEGLSAEDLADYNFDFDIYTFCKDDTDLEQYPEADEDDPRLDHVYGNKKSHHLIEIRYFSEFEKARSVALSIFRSRRFHESFKSLAIGVKTVAQSATIIDQYVVAVYLETEKRLPVKVKKVCHMLLRFLTAPIVRFSPQNIHDPKRVFSSLSAVCWPILYRDMPPNTLHRHYECKLLAQKYERARQEAILSNRESPKCPTKSDFQKDEEYKVFCHHLVFLYRHVRLRPVDLNDYYTFPIGSWKRKAAIIFNLWATHDNRKHGALKAKSYKHIWLEGGADLGKTYFIYNILLGNIPEYCILLPNTLSRNFPIEHIKPSLHRALVFDECPSITSDDWDLNFLKKITGCEHIVVNQKNVSTSIQFKLSMPSFFCRNPQGIYSGNEVNDEGLQGIAERICFINCDEPVEGTEVQFYNNNRPIIGENVQVINLEDDVAPSTSAAAVGNRSPVANWPINTRPTSSINITKTSKRSYIDYSVPPTPVLRDSDEEESFFNNLPKRSRRSSMASSVGSLVSSSEIKALKEEIEKRDVLIQQQNEKIDELSKSNSEIKELLKELLARK